MDHPDSAGNPDYRVAFERSPKRLRVVIGGMPIADTANAGLMFETNHRPV